MGGTQGSRFGSCHGQADNAPRSIATKDFEQRPPHEKHQRMAMAEQRRRLYEIKQLKRERQMHQSPR